MDRYWVTTILDGEVVGEFRRPITDPFIRQTVHVHWWDVLKILLKGKRFVDVTVSVGCDSYELIGQVLELSEKMDEIPRKNLEEQRLAYLRGTPHIVITDPENWRDDVPHKDDPPYREGQDPTHG